MARYLVTFKVRVINASDHVTAEQSEERVFECEPEKLAGAISAEKTALEARVKAAVARFDPSGSCRVSLSQTRLI